MSELNVPLNSRAAFVLDSDGFDRSTYNEDS